MSGLDGRVVVVTGAGGALGQAVCVAVANAGAKVEACDVHPDRLAQVTERIRGAGGDVATASVDLLDEIATNGWAAEILSRRGRVDGLVHLVGGWRGGTPLPEVDLADWDWLQQRLVRSLQLTSRAFHAPMAASDDARLVMVSAAGASKPTSKNACYAAAKAAAEAWMQAVAHSWQDAQGAAAVTLVINGLVTPAMRADKPAATFATLTDIAVVAREIVDLWSRPAPELNGERLWLTP